MRSRGIFDILTVLSSIVEQYSLAALPSVLNMDDGLPVVRLKIKSSKSNIGCKLWRNTPRPDRSDILIVLCDLSTVWVFFRGSSGSTCMGPGILCNAIIASRLSKYVFSVPESTHISVWPSIGAALICSFVSR